MRHIDTDYSSAFATARPAEDGKVVAFSASA
jgi:hypothetical protein